MYLKYEFGSLPKGTNSPIVKFEFGPIKIVVGGLLGGAQKGQKPPKKIDFGGRQQCVVKDRNNFKSQCS
jgi:hypothetical protein